MIEFKNILIPCDLSENARIALPFAADLARKYNARIHILHVFDEQLLSPIYFETGGTSQEYYDKLQEEFSTALKTFIGNTNVEGIEIEQKLISGNPFVEIVRYARKASIDLIVLSTHGRTGLMHTLMGSVAEKVSRKAPCPVLTIRAPDFKFVMP